MNRAIRAIAAMLRRMGARGAAGGAIAVAAMLLVVLYVKAQGTDTGPQRAAMAWLRELKTVDARWDVEVLRARTEFARAPRMNDGVQVARIRRELAAAEKTIAGADLARGAGEVHLAFARKAALVEEFRGANEASKIALSRVLGSEAEIAGLVRGTWQEFSDHERLVAAESAVTQLLAEAQRYYYLAGDAQRKNVEAVAADLRSAAERLPKALAEGLMRLDASVELLLDAKPAEEKLFARVSALTAGARADALARALADDLDRRAETRGMFRAYFAAAAAAALLLIGYLAVRMLLRYRRLDGSTAALERRLAERGRDLDDARERARRSEAQLIRTEKLSALGRMMGGVAHEINTPLAYVKGSIESVRGRLPTLAQLAAETDKLVVMLKSGGADPGALVRQLAVVQAHLADLEQRQVLGELQRLLQDGLYGIGQISEFVAGLRSFARLDHGRVTGFDLNAGLQATLAIARHELKRHRVESELGNIPPISCSPAEINQVLLNLVNHAAQAMDSGRGTIRLATRREGDAHVAVEIEDNGKGIPPDVLPRVFDPFFAGGETGAGAGLNLSISRLIVERHGGRITVDSAVGIGTKFRVILPVTPPPAEEIAA